MKLLVLAHTPPPHHGQSVMVEQLLKHAEQILSSKEFQGDLYHVNMRLSDEVALIGLKLFKKAGRLLGYCFQALRLRFWYGIDTVYYIPAPPKRSALYRDWIVMMLCRAFFQKWIFHWHAVGLGEWVSGKSCSSEDKRENKLTWIERWITQWLLGGIDLSICLHEPGRRDALLLRPKQTAIVPNGIPDPCPDFDLQLLGRRQERWQKRLRAYGGQASELQLFRVLYLAHAMREKGLFDAVEALALVNRQWEREGKQLRAQLSVAGHFFSPEERGAFEARIQQEDLALASSWLELGEPSAFSCAVSWLGFVEGEQKDRLFREADCFLFPSYFPYEGQPLSLIEAMAYGLPLVTTKWRALPTLVSEEVSFCCSPQSPSELAQGLCQASKAYGFEKQRTHFLDHYGLEAHWCAWRKALQVVGSEAS